MRSTSRNELRGNTANSATRKHGLTQQISPKYMTFDKDYEVNDKMRKLEHRMKKSVDLNM